MSGVLVVGCGGSAHGRTAATRSGTTRPTSTTNVAARPRLDRDRGDRLRADWRGAVRRGFVLRAGPLLDPRHFRVAYGIEWSLDRGIDGRGETVTVLVLSDNPTRVPPISAGILESFDSMFRLPAARIEVVTSLASSASPWQATDQEVGDTSWCTRSLLPPPCRSCCSPPPGEQAPRTRPRTWSLGCGSSSSTPTWLRSAGVWGSTSLPRLSGRMHSILRGGSSIMSWWSSPPERRAVPIRSGWGKQVEGGQLFPSLTCARWVLADETHCESRDGRRHCRDRRE